MKILILHASAGAGHQRAAEAIAKAFRSERPDADTLVSDVLDFTPALFRRTYGKGYLLLVRRAPELWGYMYERSDRKALIPWRAKLREVFNQINAASFFGFYRGFAPDITVCTHFMPLEVLSSMSRRRHVPLNIHCCVTDFAVHSLWVSTGVRCYFVATEEARRQLARRGQPEADVVVAGIPIDPVFAERREAAEARRALGLRADLPMVLALSGGFGVGATTEVIRAFTTYAGPACQVVAVAGANPKLRRRAEAAAGGAAVPVTVFGRVANMHELLDAADLVITKPGGLSTSECLAKGRPMLITDPIPGQEQRNCEYLLERGAARRLYDPVDAPVVVARLLDEPGRLDQMRENVARIGKPHAARDIARHILARSAS